MKVYALHYYTNNFVGSLCGEQSRDVSLVAIFSTLDDAKDYATDNTGWGGDQFEWHWWVQEFEIGIDPMDVVGSQNDWHFTKEMEECDQDGERVVTVVRAPYGSKLPHATALEDLEEIQQKSFNDFASKIASRLEDLSELCIDIAAELRDEF